MEASSICQVWAPGDEVAVAWPPEPYVILTVCVALRVIPLTVIVCPATETTPKFDIV